MGNMIKEKNLKLLRYILRQRRMATKSELSAASGLSVVTVQSLLHTLLESNEVIEGEMIHPELGRPALSYCFNEQVRLILVVCIFEKNGIDTADYLVCDLYGKILKRVEYRMAEIKIEDFQSRVQMFIEKYPNIAMIGFELPVAERDGVIVAGDNPKLMHLEFCRLMEEAVGIPTFLENDVNVATYGYCVRTGREDTLGTVGIYLPSKYPPGAGYYRKGQIEKGAHGFAGEIKDLPIGVNWDTFSFQESQVRKAVVDISQIMVCVEDPENIVIFSELLKQDFAAELECSIRAIDGIKPHIEIVKQLEMDVEAGMIALGLHHIL